MWHMTAICNDTRPVSRLETGHVQGCKGAKSARSRGAGCGCDQAGIGDIVKMIGDLVQCVGMFKMFHVAVMHEAGIDDVLDLVK